MSELGTIGFGLFIIVLFPAIALWLPGILFSGS